jgi:hypothetical protein
MRARSPCRVGTVDSLATVQEEPQSGADGTERPKPAADIPPLPPEITTKEQELRKLVDAGAASPEELRALAAKLQEKRTYEETLWQRDIRPALMQSKKRGSPLVGPRNDGVEKPKYIGLALLLLGVVFLLLLIATQTSFLWLLIPAVGVLVYAWMRGRSTDTEGGPPASAPDATD